jgi:hypothetical protein
MPRVGTCPDAEEEPTGSTSADRLHVLRRICVRSRARRRGIDLAMNRGMKKLSALLLTLGFAVSSTGCIVATGPSHGRRSSGVASRECKPSQHWDGERCVHNGKGRGARKHDGR